MDYANPATPVPESFLSRINPRIIVFCVVALTIIGFPMYVFTESVLTGGIRDRGDYVEVDLKTMSSFEFDQVNGTIDDVPEKWRALDGKRVMLVGEMWNAQAADDSLASFELVYSIAKCCFSGPPKIQHFVHSTVVDGKKVTYYPAQVRVLGTLHVDVKHEEGRVSSIFTYDVESVEPI